MPRKDIIWEQFLSPVVRFFIDEQELRRYSESIDWEKETANFRRGDVTIPTYYSNQHFNGIEGGYLNPSAVVKYDPITQYVLPPNATWVRQALIDAIQVKPRRILDIGCGTGTTTLMLKQAWTQAEVIGLDLSPYMLVRAEHKSQAANLDIQWRHGNGEKTGLSADSFDLVTTSLLFHEIPLVVTQAILRESFRLLRVGGQVLILDGNQKTLRQLEWLSDVFEQAYNREYAEGSLEAMLSIAEFAAVETQDVWWINQVTSAVKPIVRERQYVYSSVGNTIDNNDLQGFPAPAFDTIA